MSELNIANVQKLCDHFIREKHCNNFQILDFSTCATSDAPNGFLGCHQFLKINCTYNNATGVTENKTLHFFVKSAPTAPALNEYLDCFGVFDKEIVVYQTVIPYIKVDNEELGPLCYIVEKNLLIMEDLSKTGYRTAADRDGILDYKHLDLAVNKLAKLHVGSILMEQKAGKHLDELLPAAVKENAYPKGVSKKHMRRQNFLNGISVFLEILKTLPKYKKNIEFISYEFSKQMEYIFDLVQTSNKYVNVFSHGDLWANNIMYKYDTDGRTPISCKFIDFQLARYAPPMLDLVTILTIPTTKKFREMHYTSLCMSYFKYFAEYLKLNGLDVNHILPKAQFMEGLKEYRVAGFIESCLFLHLTVLPIEQTRKLTTSSDGFNDYFSINRVKICMEAFNNDCVYKSRLLDIFEDFIEQFILPKSRVNA